MEIQRLLTNICSKNLEHSKLFYVSLFDFKVNYDSDWFVHLISEGRGFEIGIISENHEIVPEQARAKITGAYVTFVVENVDAIFQKVQELDYKIIQAPEVTFYGQKRMLLLAPEGTVCDVSSPA